MSVSAKKKVMTPEHRLKIALAGIGRTHTAETKAKIGTANRNRTPEQRAKQAEAQRGKKRNPETGKKIGIANSKRIWKPESKEKVSLTHKGNKHRLGIKHTEADRAKMRAAQLLRWAKRKALKLLGHE
jgi:hypothetical protein